MNRCISKYKLTVTKVKSLGVSLITYQSGWDTLSYSFRVDGKLLFEGHDFKPSGMYCVDSLQTNLDLLSFLAVGVGDTDDNYFKDYTEPQMQWAMYNLRREQLQGMVYDAEANPDAAERKQALKQFTHRII